MDGCSFVLPGPPQSAAARTRTLSADDLLERRTRRRRAAEAGAGGLLQTLEVVEEQPVRLRLDLAAGQEADGLPDAVVVTISGRHEARGRGAPLLLPTSQIGHGHLQDVCLLLLGVRLLPEELGSQEGFQLLDAGVDAVPAQLLDHRLPQLWKTQTENSSLNSNAASTQLERRTRDIAEQRFTLWAGARWFLVACPTTVGAIAAESERLCSVWGASRGRAAVPAAPAVYLYAQISI